MTKSGKNKIEPKNKTKKQYRTKGKEPIKQRKGQPLFKTK